jgi:hypothetical protein
MLRIDGVVVWADWHSLYTPVRGNALKSPAARRTTGGIMNPAGLGRDETVDMLSLKGGSSRGCSLQPRFEQTAVGA